MIIEQYSNFFALYIFTVMLVPAIIMGLLGKRPKWYGILISIPALILIFGLTTRHMFQFVVFIVCESLLIMFYYLYHKRAKSEVVYIITFLLSMAPIFLIKACIYTPYNFLGFLGISYISFRVWQLIIEIHDDHIQKLPLLTMLYFITFFPTISSGPIDRFNRFTEDMNIQRTGKEYANEYLFAGLKKIAMGIIYKFAIAFVINKFIIQVLPDQKTLLSILIYMYAYTLYLFFDFAGYSNFAIGTSYLLGIKTPENFNKPFLAHNMKEFWDRWHISLSKWFGDYLFSRFVLNTLRNGTFKSKNVAVRCGYIVTMTTMGLWHGFHLFYVLYGLYQGVMLLLTDIYIKSKAFRKFKKSKCYGIVSRVVCFQVISFGMLLFSGYLLSV